MSPARATRSRGPSPPSETRRGAIRRGRPPKISQQRIVEAAIDLGLDGFSMQGIAERLGVTPPALYTHVQGRQEVLDLVAADLLGRLDVAVSESADWRGWLREFGQQARRHLSGAAEALRVPLGGPLAAHQLEASERGIQLLVEAGFSPADAGRALWLVFRVAITAGSTDDASVTAPMREARKHIDPRKLPGTLAALDALAASTDLDTFEFDLDAIVRGLEARLRSQAG